MKKLLLSAALLSAAFGYSQELVLNPTCDIHTGSTGDNADAFDITPPNNIVDDMGVEIPSPYQPIWDNDDLNAYLQNTLNGGSDVNEQASSTGDGTYDGPTKTRGLKLTNNGEKIPFGSPTARRIYQKVDLGVTAGTNYVLSLDSRSEVAGTPLEVFILNTDIITEVGLENGVTDTRVDAFLSIADNVNSSSGSETNNTFTNKEIPFTASADFVVIYMRSLNTIDEGTEVFVDNISLVEDVSLSSNDFSINGESITAYQPTSGTIAINGVEVDTANVYALNGSVVAKGAQTVDVSTLATGVYVLQVESNGKSTAKTIVIQ